MTPSHVMGSALPLAILVAVIAALAVVAGAPYLFLGGLDQEILSSEQTLVRLRKEIAGESDLQKEHRDLVVLSREANLLVEGSTAGIAGANLQKLISDVVAGHGGVASSLQILPVSEEGGLERVALRLSISVDIDGLRDIMHGIETGRPLLFIDDLIVRAGEQKESNADPHFLGPLDVEIQVSGFRLKDKAT